MVENENYKSYTANNGTELRFPKESVIQMRQSRETAISIETVILAHRQRMPSAPAMESGVLTTSRECLAIRFIRGAWHGESDGQRKFPAKITNIDL